MSSRRCCVPLTSHTSAIVDLASAWTTIKREETLSTALTLHRPQVLLLQTRSSPWLAHCLWKLRSTRVVLTKQRGALCAWCTLQALVLLPSAPSSWTTHHEQL